MRTKTVIPYLAAIAGIAAVVAVSFQFQSVAKTQPGTAALLLVGVVLLLALKWGTRPAFIGSVSGVLAFGWVFLSPRFSLGAPDTILFAGFVLCLVLVSRLSAHARRGAGDSEQLYVDLQRENAERRRAEERFRGLLESAPDAMVIVDRDGRIRIVNSQAEKLFGYRREELHKQPVELLMPRRFRFSHEMHRAAYSAGPKTRAMGAGLELYGRHKSGREFPVDIYLSPLQTEEGMLVTAAIRDVSESKRVQERVRYIAEHDALTGLPNRIQFKERLEQAVAHALRTDQQVAVLFADLDDFKRINDSLGHRVGDALLRTAAQRLRRCVRASDSVARFGGDEFVICMAGARDDAAAVLASKVLEALREPFLIDPHELYIGASIGISVFPHDGRAAEALMAAADTAMYHAKERGRNNYQFYTARLNETAQRRLTVANLLRQALQRDELVLHYQPQIELRSGRVFCAEALLRWHQASLGNLVLPGEFIRIAENTGLIGSIGEWVLREACAQLKQWRDHGLRDLHVAINLSPHQLRRAGFIELCDSTLREFGLPAAALEMELPEGALMAQGAENLTALERLAGMGVQLAVDDFGTGYFNLAYLRRFPVHSLKIDRSFVDGIGREPDDTAVVSAIIAMARSLRLNVVAEGVETPAQEDYFKTQGCLAAQGFYYGEAVPVEAFSSRWAHADVGRPSPAAG
jgi:diguanylate cyclase (GGDEF)-like protein/PAS domain S-box-containing protein